MKSLTDQEYLTLCWQLTDEQYDHDIIDDYDLSNMEWMPAEATEKLVPTPIPSGMIDLTHVKSSEIKKQIFLSTNFRIGNFKIRLHRYSVSPSQEGARVTTDITVWEERHKTPNGVTCRVDYPMLFERDDRFIGRSWLKYFNSSHTAYNVPIEIVTDIMRWLQC